jgi:hypothetical protein
MYINKSLAEPGDATQIGFGYRKVFLLQFQRYMTYVPDKVQNATIPN